MVDTDVLLVDDDKDTCASMSDILRDIGYTVDLAYDGAEALVLSGRHEYRLALLDYRMPGMDGLELCRRLKDSQPGVVVALITAFASVVTTASAAEAGVWRTLLKPVNFSVLLPFVEEAVNARAGTPDGNRKRRRTKGSWEGRAGGETMHGHDHDHHGNASHSPGVESEGVRAQGVLPL